MAELLSEQTIALFGKFIVPGLIIMYVRSLFLTSRLPPLSEAIVAYLLISIVYTSLVSAALKQLAVAEGDIVTFSTTIMIPAIFGLMLGLNIQHELTFRAFRFFGLKVNHPIPAAWDWKLSQCGEAYIMVILDDGTKWAGHFSSKSFGSTDGADRDIYIEQVYDWFDDKPWEARKSGVWLNRANIKSIEFWPPVERNENE